MNKCIGVFDSGIGGLTLVKALINKLPNINIVYFGDTKNMPYGNKTKEEIITHVKNAISFLNTFSVDSIIIACNTADSNAKKEVEKLYDIPIYGVIDTTCKQAINTTKNKKIGVIATSACIESNEYPLTLKKYNDQIEIHTKACPLLAQLIEEGSFDINNQQVRIMIKEYVEPLINKNIDTLILGCTHYDLIMDIVKDMYPNINLISSSRCIVEDIKKDLQDTCDNIPIRKYYVSKDKDKFKKIASSFMKDIEIKEI